MPPGPGAPPFFFWEPVMSIDSNKWMRLFTTFSGIVSLLACGFLLISVLVTTHSMETYVSWLERYLSPDGRITKPLKVVLVTLYGSLWIAVFFFNHSPGPGRSLLSNPPWRRISTPARLLFVGSLLLMLNWVVFFRHQLYEEDGVFESATAVIALAAGIVFVCLAVRRLPVRQRITYGLLAAAFVFFAMEEISWGQRLIGWQTPEAWKSANIQHETNLHNLLSEYLFVPVNFFALLILGAVFLNARWLSHRNIRIGQPWLRYLTPRDEYYLLGYPFYLLSLASLAVGTEVAEEIIAVLGLTVSLRHLRQPQLEAR